MPKHEVKLWIDHAIPIGKVDVQFPVTVDGKALGRLQVSTGSIDWVPSPNSKTGHWLTWSEFADLMREHGHSK